jgi:hypothetical protein
MEKNIVFFPYTYIQSLLMMLHYIVDHWKIFILFERSVLEIFNENKVYNWKNGEIILMWRSSLDLSQV